MDTLSTGTWHMSGHAHRQLAAYRAQHARGTAGIRGAVGPHGVADEYA